VNNVNPLEPEGQAVLQEVVLVILALLFLALVELGGFGDGELLHVLHQHHTADLSCFILQEDVPQVAKPILKIFRGEAVKVHIGQLHVENTSSTLEVGHERVRKRERKRYKGCELKQSKRQDPQGRELNWHKEGSLYLGSC